jgi:cell pole-organizing protein PopZ
MSDPKDPGNDPSMDDILASIRKIISDDEARAQVNGAASAESKLPGPTAASASASTDRDDVLLLTDLLDEPKTAPPRPTLVPPPAKPDPVSSAQAQVPQPSVAPIPPPFIPLPPTVAAEQQTVPTPSTSAAKPIAPVEPPVKQPLADRSLVEPDAAGLAASAFHRLSQAVQESVPRPAATDPGPSVGPSGRNLEDIVKELLRPMLKEWLDKNLPTMVERFVEREIVRLTRR